jgi:hypothetical protein
MENNFNTSIRYDISELAKLVLIDEEIEEATDLSDCLNDIKEKRDCALSILKNKIGTRPKRPVFYLNCRINFLPEETRDVVRYAGDYIDQLIKCLASEKGVFGFLSEYSSLGNNIKRARTILDPKILDALEKYNKLIYVPAKHDFNVGDRPHLFSNKEAVFILFITQKLAKEIINLSENAKNYILR